LSDIQLWADHIPKKPFADHSLQVQQQTLENVYICPSMVPLYICGGLAAVFPVGICKGCEMPTGDEHN
jgi:hypothetical protein